METPDEPSGHLMIPGMGERGMSDKYILVDGEPVMEPDLMRWAQWFEESGDERIIEQTELGEVRVSTVFLGLDHRFGEGLNPILWETMIFGGPHDGYQERFASREDAVLGHKIAVDLASEVM